MLPEFNELIASLQSHTTENPSRANRLAANLGVIVLTPIQRISSAINSTLSNIGGVLTNMFLIAMNQHSPNQQRNLYLTSNSDEHEHSQANANDQTATNSTLPSIKGALTNMYLMFRHQHSPNQQRNLYLTSNSDRTNDQNAVEQNASQTRLRPGHQQG